MNYIEIVWNDKKNKLNQQKHGISFTEAKTVFFDENARLISDTEHSLYEERFILLGLSNVLKMLIVVHSYREDNEVVRIISARKATKNETKLYNRRKKK